VKSSEKIMVIWTLLTALFDGIAIFTSVILAYFIRYSQFFYDILPPPMGLVPSFYHYSRSAIVAAVVLVIFLAIRGIYHQRWRESVARELRELLENFYLGFALLFALIYFYRGFLFSRIVAIMTLILASLLLIIIRYLFFHLRRKAFHTASPMRVMVIGDQLEEVERRLLQVPQIGMQLIRTLATSPAVKLPEDLFDQVKQDAIDTIILVYSFNDFERAREVIHLLGGMRLNFFFAPDPKGLVTGQIRSFNVSGIPMLKLRQEPFVGWNRLVKRSFDLILSGFLSLILSPIFIFTILSIKLTSRCTIFYKQERVGLDGKEFAIYKFRSMRLDAEQTIGPVWASKDDSRTTALGHFLRRWSIDELPQLWNIIRGEMSLVGPRPERPFFVEQFQQAVPRYVERHRVLCGLTGWAQVNGLRGQAPIEDRTKYDLFYIENWSLGFDIKILFMTIFAVIFGRDAY